MPKAYWIGRVDVGNPDGYKAYVAANAEPFRKYGAKFLVRGGQFENPEGASRSRNSSAFAMRLAGISLVRKRATSSTSGNSGIVRAAYILTVALVR